MPIYLLDTCTYIWHAKGQSSEISPAAAAILAGPAGLLVVSIISFLEIALKVSAGRLVFPTPLRAVERRFLAAGSTVHGLDTAVLDTYIRMPALHPDPFDRMIAATAKVTGATILSPDTAFDLYGAARLW
jgi:PIN domain nuclease of toxin-antitoxin system